MANSKEAVTAQAKKDQRAKDGAEALAQYEAHAVHVRQNMARLMYTNNSANPLFPNCFLDAFDNGTKLQLDALNLFNVKAEQIAYAYDSRLNGETSASTYDKHIHPVEPLAVRLTLSGRF